MRFDEEEDCYLDTKTNLKWSKENLGPMTWDEAIKAPKGWKLPNIEEILTIMYHYTKNGIATELPNMLPSYYWSSTVYTDYSDSAYFVNSYNGFDYYGSMSNEYCARYVKED